MADHPLGPDQTDIITSPGSGTGETETRDTCDGTWHVCMKKMGELNYYLQDELGKSGFRIEDSWNSKESYGYEPFWKTCIRTRGRYSRLAIRYQREMRLQGRIMPKVREYLAESGRSAGWI